MIKIVVALHRRADLSPEEFQDHWLHRHPDVVTKLPGLRRYVQSHVLLSGYRRAQQPVLDGIAELWFDDTDALRALVGTDESAAVRADEERFLAPGGMRQVLVDTYVIKDGPIPPDAIKSIELVRRKAGMDLDDFRRYWRDHHGPLAARIGPLRRYEQDHARATSYRNGAEPAYDGFAVTWFTGTDAMRSSAATAEYAATRGDEHNFLTLPLDEILTREHVIVDGPVA